jgi:small subunit ribosomal protein S14
MAKKSKIIMNNKRKALVERYAPLRKELQAVLRNPRSTQEERNTAAARLRNIPRNANPTRIHNRCWLTGRSRGYYRKFGLSRIAVRELGLRGEIPGLKKSSW